LEMRMQLLLMCMQLAKTCIRRKIFNKTELYPDISV
jgi:hypothetical protein